MANDVVIVFDFDKTIIDCDSDNWVVDELGFNECDLRIISDANVFFIETVLKQYGILECFREIKTNPSYVDGEGRLRILPYHDFNSSSHGCHICPPNMCKGVIMERIRATLSAEGKKRFVHAGDGIADFCAGLKLEEGDYLLPRKDFPVWDVICKNPTLIKANIREWSNWNEFETVLLNTVNRFLVADKSSVRADQHIPVDCKFHSSISGHQSALPVPH
ncbi:hypothetical protein TIFTF001_005671 [Ficus carica]|uniref:Uncharacterized protein n=1 Tax=Ficus carica TaxID=3494 RepID=A0AA87ZL63_FICCA|nr:hypothetical protein TIFTF001_005671 [Ficus carica]